MAIELESLLAKISLDAGDFTGGLDKVLTGTRKFGSYMDSLAASLFSPAGLVGAIAAVGTASFQSAMEFDAAYDEIRTATGATGDEFDKLTASFKNVYTNVASASRDVSSAIGILNQKLELVGKPLEEFAVQMLNLSRITGTDLKGNIEAVATAFRSWDVDAGKYADTADFLFRVFQATGAKVGDLASSLKDAGPVLRAFGFEFQDAAVLLGNFSRMGIDSQTAANGLNKALALMAQQGITPSKDALDALIQRIKGTETQAGDTALAVEIFGTRAGPKLAQQIQEGKFEVTALTEAIQGNADTINKVTEQTDDFGQTWSKTWHTMQSVLEPIGKVLLWLVNEVFYQLNEEIKAFAKFFDVLGKGITELWNKIIAPLPGTSWLTKVLGFSKDAKDAKKPTDDLAHSMGGLKTASEQTAKAVVKTKDELKAQKEAAKQLTEQIKAANEATLLIAYAQDKWEAQLRKTKWESEALAEYIRTGVVPAAGAYTKGIQEIDDALRSMHNAVGNLASTLPELSAEMQKISGAGTASNINAVADAFGRMGVASSTAIATTRTQAEADYATIRDSGVASAYEIQQAWVKLEESRRREALATGAEWTKADEAIYQESKRILDEMEGAVTTSAAKQKDNWGGMFQQVSTNITNTAQDIVGILIGTKDGSIVDALKRLGESVLTAFTEPAIAYFEEFIEKGIKKAIGWLLSETGLSGALGSVGKAIAGIFSGSSGAVGGAVSGAGGAVGGAGGGVGGAVGAVGGGLTGALGAIGSIGSMVSGFIGNFQNARQENTLNAIEESTRYTKIGTVDEGGIISLLWKQLDNQLHFRGLLEKIEMNTLDLFDRVEWNLKPDIAAIRAAVEKGREIVVNLMIQGNVIGNQEFLDDVSDAIAAQLKLEGVPA